MPDVLADVVGEHTGIELPTSNYLMGIPLEPAATTIVEASPGYMGKANLYKQVGHSSGMTGLRFRDMNRH